MLVGLVPRLTRRVTMVLAVSYFISRHDIHEASIEWTRRNLIVLTFFLSNDTGLPQNMDVCESVVGLEHLTGFSTTKAMLAGFV